MGRFTIHATIAVDVNAKDEVEAFEHFADAINTAADERGIRDIVVQHSETKVVAFPVPPGAERWAAAATAIRLGEDRKLAAMHDGAWWWSDGYVALRCDGPPPDDYKVIPDGELTKGIPKKPRPTTWSEPRNSKRDPNIVVCVANHSDKVAIQDKYRALVDGSVQGVTWQAGKTTASATMAFDGDKLVAFVMPCLVDPVPGTYEATQSESKEP